MSNGFLAEQNAEQPPSPVEVATAPVVELEISPEDSPLQAEERAMEQLQEVATQENFLHTQTPEGQAPAQAESVAASGVMAQPVMKDEVTKEVEKILEDGLGDYFHTLPENAQARFQKKGEEVAIQVAGMVRGFKVEVKRVLGLIRDWLLTVPGVNKFFLEQEAKIKTDRILELEQVYHEEAQNKP